MTTKIQIDKRKLIVLGLSLAAVSLYVWSYFVPIWGFYLYAPQYPYGLTLGIYVDRLSGDTTEINILNHYIGMAKLESAAQLERSLAVYGLGGIALVTMLFVFLPGRRYAKWLAAPALIFPVVFLSLMTMWMYRFGHELSPAAPVHMAPFTPTLMGTGRIGNFSTLGMPGAGFYMIAGAALLVGLGLFVRQKICKGCGSSDKCRAICPHFTIASPPRKKND